MENSTISYSLMTFSKMCRIYFLKNKDEAFDQFKVLNALVENEVDLKFKCLIFNQGVEHISN